MTATMLRIGMYTNGKMSCDSGAPQLSPGTTGNLGGARSSKRILLYAATEGVHAHQHSALT